MKTLPTDYGDEVVTYSHQQLVDALQAEYIQLMHDVEPTEDDFTLDEHLDYLNNLSHAELIVETATDEENPLSEFMYTYSWYLLWGLLPLSRFHIYIIHLYFTYTCSPINHLHSLTTSSLMYCVALVTSWWRMVHTIVTPTCHVVHYLTLTITLQSLWVCGSIVTALTSVQTKSSNFSSTLLDSFNTSNYSFT